MDMEIKETEFNKIESKQTKANSKKSKLKNELKSKSIFCFGICNVIFVLLKNSWCCNRIKMF